MAWAGVLPEKIVSWRVPKCAIFVYGKVTKRSWRTEPPPDKLYCKAFITSVLLELLIHYNVFSCVLTSIYFQIIIKLFFLKNLTFSCGKITVVILSLIIQYLSTYQFYWSQHIYPTQVYNPNLTNTIPLEL